MKRIIIALLFTILVGSLLPATSEASTDVNYNNAVKQGNSLRLLTISFNATIDDGDIAVIDSMYDELSSEIKKTEKMIGKVSGSKNRKTLNEKYVTPAKVARERVIYEVSQFRLLFVIEDWFQKNDFESMEKDYAKLERLKKRAVEIKKAGGYKALPTSVNNELDSYEQWIKDRFTFTPIEQMPVFQTHQDAYTYRLSEDLQFNSNTRYLYDNGLALIWRYSVEHREVYWLNGNYDTISGKIVIGKQNEGVDWAGSLKIKVDGSEVYYTDIPATITEPWEFDVDLRGANLVEVTLRGSNIALTDTNFNR
ncbi:hypothetical protein [Metabacillus endolithicus]|uniref:SbsC C-terminal domain-containing protein n=1 Tax=Metabacillus endolithicus TaxID=1535204 RepID=A0ABW5C267_9BACI|nr:hypothetical protein [Metabacillus endolithicus]UPG65511.1 hypothetical protein MVE64_11380 [Metabacillus endolithicus]